MGTGLKLQITGRNEPLGVKGPSSEFKHTFPVLVSEMKMELFPRESGRKQQHGVFILRLARDLGEGAAGNRRARWSLSPSSPPQLHIKCRLLQIEEQAGFRNKQVGKANSSQ